MCIYVIKYIALYIMFKSSRYHSILYIFYFLFIFNLQDLSVTKRDVLKFPILSKAGICHQTDIGVILFLSQSLWGLVKLPSKVWAWVQIDGRAFPSSFFLQLFSRLLCCSEVGWFPWLVSVSCGITYFASLSADF